MMVYAAFFLYGPRSGSQRRQEPIFKGIVGSTGDHDRRRESLRVLQTYPITIVLPARYRRPQSLAPKSPADGALCIGNKRFGVRLPAGERSSLPVPWSKFLGVATRKVTSANSEERVLIRVVSNCFIGAQRGAPLTP